MKLYMNNRPLGNLNNNEMNELVQHLILTYSFDIPFTTDQLIKTVRKQRFNMVLDSFPDDTIYNIFDPGEDAQVLKGTSSDIYESRLYEKGVLLGFEVISQNFNDNLIVKLTVLTEAGIQTATDVANEAQAASDYVKRQNGDES